MLKRELFYQIEKVITNDRLRSEWHDKNDNGQHTQRSSTRRERFVFIVDVRVFQSQEIDEQSPDEPADPEKNTHKDKDPENIGSKIPGFFP